MKKLMLLPLLLLTLMACGQQNSNTITNDVKTNQHIMNQEEILKPVKELIDAMQKEDAARIRAQFSNKATQAYGADGKMKSAEETKTWIGTDIVDRKGKVENPQFNVLSDTVVVVTGQYKSIGYTNKANFLFTVENGLITSWRMRY